MSKVDFFKKIVSVIVTVVLVAGVMPVHSINAYQNASAFLCGEVTETTPDSGLTGGSYKPPIETLPYLPCDGFGGDLPCDSENDGYGEKPQYDSEDDNENEIVPEEGIQSENNQPFDSDTGMVVNIIFPEDLQGEDTLFIEHGSVFDLLEYVIAVDENGNNAAVFVLCDDDFSVYAEWPDNGFTITYGAVHPFTMEKFTRTRQIVVIAVLVMPLNIYTGSLVGYNTITNAYVTPVTAAHATWSFNSVTGIVTVSGGTIPNGSQVNANGTIHWMPDPAMRNQVTQINLTAPLTAGNIMDNFFRHFPNLQAVNNAGELVTGSTTVMANMFNGASNLTTVDVSAWNTANVTNMANMFLNASSLTALDISGWNTANVSRMDSMFNGASSLTALDVSAWNTANLTTAGNMFQNASGLTALDVSGWNTAAVTNMAGMFQGASGLLMLDVSGWNTANVTSMGNMFQNVSGLTALDVSGWNTAAVTNMANMFNGASNLTALDVSGWNTAIVTNMGNMFLNASGLTELDLSGWSTSSGPNMNNMLNGVGNLERITFGPGFTTIGAGNALTLHGGNTAGGWLNLQTGAVINTGALLWSNLNTAAGVETWVWRYVPVTFNSRGGSAVTQQTVIRGSVAARPADPTLANHDFGGWFTSEAVAQGTGGTEFDFATTAITGNITLYARWTLQNHTVTFNSRGGSAVTSQTIARGSVAARPADPTLANHNFGGWFASEAAAQGAGGTEFDFATTAITGNITLYARWTLQNHTVTFNSRGGSAVTSQTIAHGSVATRPADPTLANHDFGGWFTSEAVAQGTGGTEFDFAATAITGNITLYARWTLQNGNDSNNNNGGDSDTGGGNGGTGSGNNNNGGNNDTNDNDSPDIPPTPNLPDNNIVPDTGGSFREYTPDGKLAGIWHFDYTTDEWVFTAERTRPLPLPLDSREENVNRTRRSFIKGFPDGTVRPDSFVTRAQMAQMFFNLAGNPEKYDSNFNGFSDVTPEGWYYPAVSFFAAADILIGYPDGSFRPDRYITNAEFAAFAVIAFDLERFGIQNFVDGMEYHWAENFVNIGFDTGWFNYFGGNYVFSPDAPITRAQAITLLNHYTGRVAHRPSINMLLGTSQLFHDIDRSHWAFYEIKLAANCHDYVVVEGYQLWIADRKNASIAPV